MSLTEKNAVPLEVFSRGGTTTRRRYGKSIFSLIARVRHEKNPRIVARLKKEIAELVAAKKAAKKKKK